MSAWIVITREHLKDYLVDAQLAALSEAALGDGQADPFDRIMQDRATYVRNRISNRLLVSATDFSVPPELKTAACMLIIEAMQGRLSIAMPLTEDQRTSIRRAYSDLDIAGTDKFPVSNPDNPIPAPVQSGPQGVVVAKPANTLTREDMRGL